MLPNGPAGWGQVRRCSLAYLQQLGRLCGAAPGREAGSPPVIWRAVICAAPSTRWRRCLRSSVQSGHLRTTGRTEPGGRGGGSERRPALCRGRRRAVVRHTGAAPRAPVGGVPLRISATTVWPTAHGPARGFPTHATDPRQGASTSRLVRGQPSEWPCPAAGTCVSAPEGVLQLLFGHGRAALDVALLGLFVELVFCGSLCAAV